MAVPPHHRLEAALLAQQQLMQIPAQLMVPAHLMPPAVPALQQTGPPAAQSHNIRQAGEPTGLEPRAQVEGTHSSPKLSDLVINKRPLNSFMAFRSYYSPIFSNLQQKEASAYLCVLWQNDPFKAKWTVVAKAWSIIRDALGKAASPLKPFLNIACPAIGIIEVSEYLIKLNWIMITTSDGRMTLQQTSPSNLDSFLEGRDTKMMSEFELIQFAIDLGYMPIASKVFTDPTNRTHVLLASSGRYNPNEAKREFFKAIREDPKALIARILGFEMDHPFLEISCSVGPSEVESPRTQRKFVPPPPPYNWTGTMSELYQPNELAMNLDGCMNEQSWETTDVGIPTILDNYLQATGFDTAPAPPNIQADNQPPYNFWDSF